MSKSQSAGVPGTSKHKGRKKGKKDRKHGRGILKLSHSKWGTYAGLMAHQTSIRLGRMARRFCKSCHTQFHSRAAYRRHECHASKA